MTMSVGDVSLLFFAGLSTDLSSGNATAICKCKNEHLASRRSQTLRRPFDTISKLNTYQTWGRCKPGFSLLVYVYVKTGDIVFMHCFAFCSQKQNPPGVGVIGLSSATFLVLVSLAKESNKLDAVDDNSLMLLGPFRMESSKVKIADMSR